MWRQNCMLLNHKLIRFVEDFTDGAVVVHTSISNSVVFQMKTLFSLKELTEAVANEFPCVEFDYPVDKRFIIMNWE